jgi:hypothetical protein
MKKLLLFFIVFAIVFCANTQPAEQFVVLPKLVFPQIMYYGANLGLFPPEAREFITNEQFTKEDMEDEGSLHPKLKVWWSDDNNSVLMEASYTVAPGYEGAGTIETWGEDAVYSGDESIFDTYGKYACYQTLRFRYEYSVYAQQLVRIDPVYAEIAALAKQLCREIEYDRANLEEYKGARVRQTPGMRRMMCEGYTEEIVQKALQLKSVKAVQKWSSEEHIWNVLKLADGRTLFLDLTWFDNDEIDEKTGRIRQTPDYDWANLTFHEHLFRFSGVGLDGKTFEHDKCQMDEERKK